MSHQIHQEFNTDLNSLKQVLSWFKQFDQPPIPRQTWLYCQLALAEGFTNAVRYAHAQMSPATPIEIQVLIAKQYLEICIWDYGPPFDLASYLSMLPETTDTEAEGGRGLKLINQIADFLSYNRTPDHRNCLVIRKHFVDNSC
ncbi:MAG: ATP-binding protein [Cyanothece sp. SIO1E1]|nr:ATP-binding protein [Cyanothece sp. SIO1E1]